MSAHPYTPKLVSALGHYDRTTFGRDLLAGLTVAIVALPLSMALAVASGVSPEKGIITAISAGFMISALGGSRVQIGGPTGAFVVVILDVIARHGIEGLLLATFLAGFFLIAAGYLRLGIIVKFLPHSVITGFTAGIALIIFTTQVKDFLGLTFHEPTLGVLSQWVSIGRHLPSLNGYSVLIGVGSLLFILALKTWVPRAPGYLIVLVLSSVGVYVLKLPVETIGIRFPTVSDHLPALSMPPFSLSKVHEVLPSAMIIAFLAGVESLLSAMVADSMTGYKHRPNQELVGQGIANIFSACVGGLPATGALARTATNIKAGGRTPIAGVAHAVFMLMFMLLGLKSINFIPMATLAAILFVVAWGMSEVHHFVHLFKISYEDRLIILTTFLLTVFVDLTVGISVGVGLSSLLFIEQMSRTLGVSRRSDSTKDDQENQREQLPKGAEVLFISGPMFYGVVEDFLDTVKNIGSIPQVLILDMSSVPYMDTTGLRVFKVVLANQASLGTKVIFSGVKKQIFDLLSKGGLLKEGSGVYSVSCYKEAIGKAENLLIELKV